MLNLKQKLFATGSMVLMSFAMVGCDSGSTTPPPMAPNPNQQQAQNNNKSASANQKALNSQGGALIAGTWNCTSGNCDKNETLQISSDLKKFIKSGTGEIKDGSGRECDVSEKLKVNITNLQDQGQFVKINATELDGSLSYTGEKGDLDGDSAAKALAKTAINCEQDIDDSNTDLKDSRQAVSIIIVVDKNHPNLQFEDKNGVQLRSYSKAD